MNFITKYLSIILISAFSSSSFPAGEEPIPSILKRSLSRNGSSSSGYGTDTERASEPEDDFLIQEATAGAAALPAVLPPMHPFISPTATEDDVIQQAHHILTADQPQLSLLEKEFTQSILDLLRHKRTLGNFLRAWGKRYPMANPYLTELVSLVLHNDDSYYCNRNRLLTSLGQYIPAPFLCKIRRTVNQLEQQCKKNVQSMAQHAINAELRSRKKLVSTDKVRRALESLVQKLAP